MRLYDCSTAPSPRRVRIFAAEKGLDIERVPVDLAGGEQLSPEFRAINPDCVVPVLELDDGTHVTEVIAICQYLEELQPEPRLFGNDARERALATMWNAKAEFQGLWAMAETYRNYARGLKGRAVPGPDNYEQIPALVDRGRQRVAAFMRRLDSRLQEHEYLAGARFSIADITALVTLDFAALLKITINPGQAALQRWYENVAQRPSAAA